jgi:hypothetical protein
MNANLEAQSFSLEFDRTAFVAYGRFVLKPF